MKVVPVKTLKEFSIRHPQSGRAIALIINDLKKEFFENVNRLKDHFPYISVLKDNRVVFNICGNKYRLICLLPFLLDLHDSVLRENMEILLPRYYRCFVEIYT